MPVYGDGGQTRDFTFVEDVVDGVLSAGSAKGVSGRVYNLAGGRPVSVLEMGRILAGLMGKEAVFEFRPPRAGDIRDSYADVESARRELAHRAGTPLDEGLRRTAGRRSRSGCFRKRRRRVAAGIGRGRRREIGTDRAARKQRRRGHPSGDYAPYPRNH